MAKLLNRDEEQVLILKAQYGDIAARNLLIERNLGLMYTAINRVCRRVRIPPEELIGYAAEKFIECIDRFDINRDHRLSTLAMHMMMNDLRRRVFSHGGPINLPGTYCSPSVRNRLSAECRERIEQAKNVRSIDERFTVKGKKTTVCEMVSFEENTSEEGHIMLDRMPEVMDAVDDLPPKMREVICLRMRKTLVEAGLELGVSRERIRQIEEKALERLRRVLRV